MGDIDVETDNNEPDIGKRQSNRNNNDSTMPAISSTTNVAKGCFPKGVSIPGKPIATSTSLSSLNCSPKSKSISISHQQRPLLMVARSNENAYAHAINGNLTNGVS